MKVFQSNRNGIDINVVLGFRKFVETSAKKRYTLLLANGNFVVALYLYLSRPEPAGGGLPGSPWRRRRAPPRRAPLERWLRVRVRGGGNGAYLGRRLNS